MRVTTARTLDDAQMERIIRAADPNAIIFDVKTKVVDGETIKEKRLHERWINLRDQLLYFEWLYRQDVERRDAPKLAQKKRARIAAHAKRLASLIADDLEFIHHRDALTRLITDAEAPRYDNPELGARKTDYGAASNGSTDELSAAIQDAAAFGFAVSLNDKRSPFDVLIRDRLMPVAHEYFGRAAIGYSVDPQLGAYGSFIDFAGAVLNELKITKANGQPYSRKAIATTR